MSEILDVLNGVASVLTIVGFVLHFTGRFAMRLKAQCDGTLAIEAPEGGRDQSRDLHPLEMSPSTSFDPFCGLVAVK